jgi:hypothetical protein
MCYRPVGHKSIGPKAPEKQYLSSALSNYKIFSRLFDLIVEIDMIMSISEWLSFGLLWTQH